MHRSQTGLPGAPPRELGAAPSLLTRAASPGCAVDILGTALSGYSGERPRTEGPDFGLVDEMVAACELPVMVEGRVHSPAQAAEALARGAFAVCVGTAITHPTTITGWFAEAVAAAR